MRVLAYHPSQLADNTYSGVGSMTWSIVEQGIGIVCACLPTLRPLMAFTMRDRRQRNTKKNSSIGMDTYRSGTVRLETGTGAKSSWKPAYDSESTVGFARLQDEERSLYPPLGSAITTSGGQEDCKGGNMISGGILKEQTIDQRSEVIR